MLLSNSMHWDFGIILFFLGAVVPWLGYRRMRRLIKASSITTTDRLALYASTIAFQWFAAAIILWRTAVQGIRPAQLGLAVGNPGLTASVSVVLSGLVLANQIFSVLRLRARPAEIKGTLPQLALKVFPQTEIERLAFLALVSTVCFCEELIYRGFVQRVFEDAARGYLFVGIVASAIFFALAHVYQGRKGLLSTFVIGLVFATIRSWTGSLVPSMCAHFVADLAVGIAAPKRLRAALEAQEHEPEAGRGG
jgi:uncharacterized protein